MLAAGMNPTGAVLSNQLLLLIILLLREECGLALMNGESESQGSQAGPRERVAVFHVA